MSLFAKRMDLLTVIAIVTMAISISIFDFSDLSWDANFKSYIGLLVFVVLVVMRYFVNRNLTK